MNTILFALISLLVISCGDSPFLEDKENEQIQGQQGLISENFFNDSKVQLDMHWLEEPEVGREAKLMIILTDQDNAIIKDDIDIRVMLWMPTMGHGSFPVTVEKVSDGIYKAREVFFTMPGYWDVHFQIFENNVLKEEVLWGLDF